MRTKLTPPTGPPTETNYLVDTAGTLSHVVAETDGVGALQALYVRGDDLLSIQRPGQIRHVHADGLGSIRRLTDETGAVTDSYTYTAFGETLDHTGSDPQPYQFAGEPYDPNSGFYYNRARWLDASLARFASIDPFRGLAFEPSFLHLYTYGEADPANNVDPTGEYAEMTIVGQSTIQTAMIVLSTLARAAAIVCTASIVGSSLASAAGASPPSGPCSIDPFDTVQIYRAFGGSGNPGEFKRRPGIDDDGLSFSEFPRTDNPAKPYQLMLRVRYVKPKFAGARGDIVFPPIIATAGGRATYTPQFGPGHWSVNLLVGADLEKNLLSKAAKALMGR